MASKSSSGGVSATTVLLIVFVVLKLTHTINWSWWWVLSPIWITIALVVVILAFAGLMYGIARAVK